MQTASEFERREKKRIVTAFIVSFALAVLALFFASVAKGAPGADPESRIPSPGLSAPSPESRIPSPGFFVPSSESRLFRPESRLPSFRFLMRNGRLVAFASPQPPAPSPYNQTPTSSQAVYASVWDSTNGALRINATLAANPNAGGNPTTVFEFLKQTYDPTNGALFVNCVVGCSAGATSINLFGGALGSAPYQAAANTTAFIPSPTTSGHTFVYAWQPSGSAIAPTAVDANTLAVSSAATATAPASVPWGYGNGGTNATTQATARNNLFPCSVEGSIAYWTSSAAACLATGTSSQVLVGGTDPAWGTVTQTQFPTALIGPDTRIKGGILGLQEAGAVYAVFGWFGNSGLNQVAFGSDLWINGLTAYISATMGTGAYYNIGPAAFNGTTQFTVPYVLAIPNNATAGAYQASNPAPIFIPSNSGTGVQVSGLSPTNATAATMRGVTANVVGVATQPLGVFLNGNSVAGSTTVYTGFSQSAITTQTAENLTFVIAPYAFTASNLCIALKGAAPSGGTFTATLRKATSGGSYTPADTPLVATVVASGGIGTYCDTADSQAFSATDAFDVKLINGSSSTGPTLYSVTMLTTLPGGATGMIIFGTGGQTMTNNNYYPAFTSSAGTATEVNTSAPAPRVFTASNLSCYVTTAPGTDAANLTVRQNAASPGSGLTVQLALLTTGLIQDVAHTIAFANKDLFDLLDTQASGTAPAVSSCSMQVN